LVQKRVSVGAVSLAFLWDFDSCAAEVKTAVKEVVHHIHHVFRVRWVAGSIDGALEGVFVTVVVWSFKHIIKF
jgi:hypothetical protein